jgi:hypothetical protein
MSGYPLHFIGIHGFGANPVTVEKGRRRVGEPLRVWTRRTSACPRGGWIVLPSRSAGCGISPMAPCLRRQIHNRHASCGAVRNGEKPEERGTRTDAAVAAPTLRDGGSARPVSPAPRWEGAGRDPALCVACGPHMEGLLHAARATKSSVTNHPPILLFLCAPYCAQ